MSVYGLNDTKFLLSGNYDKNRIMSAVNFADKYHFGQVRKSIDKEPFIKHCLNVGDILAKSSKNEDTVIAGILHDTIEDTVVTKNDLSKTFGKNVSELVDWVTEQDKSKSWMERFEDYIRRLKLAPADAQCISAADKIDNMRSMTDSLKRDYNIFQNMKGSPKMQLDKFNKVFNIVKDNLPADLKNMYINSLDDFVNILKKFKL